MSLPSPQLLKKYNVPGPRYTSYPTVPYWENTPSSEEWLKSLKNSLSQALNEKTGAAVYIHIPFCEALCTYCGCNTRITRNHKVAAPYIETILKEWKLYREKLGFDRIPIADLHLGGGTPTFLSPSELQSLIEGILEGAELSLGENAEPSEFSLEADPRVTTQEQLDVLAKLGFRRLSFGIQDFDPKVQAIVNRVQTPEQVKTLTEAARERGYTSINYDLIYGLPFQTLKSVERTIDLVRELKPDRIAFYAYAHVPWIKPSQRKFTEADLPSGDEKRALYELGRKMLEESGYREIGMDHFALETDSLWSATRSKRLHRNFMGYISRDVFPLMGLGVSAISDSWDAFSQNEKHLESYQRKVQSGEIPILRGHVLTEEDKVIRKHILNLMTRFSTKWASEEPSTPFTPYLESVPQKLREAVQDGLLRFDRNQCEVTEKGRPFLRNICMAFDARLAKKAPDREIFSQTI